MIEKDLFFWLLLSHDTGEETGSATGLPFEFGNLLVQFFLLSADRFRGHNPDTNEKIAVFTPSFYPLSANLERSTKLDSRRDVQVNMALIDRLDLCCSPDDCLGRTDLDSGLEIVTGPDKPVMGLNINFDEEVSVCCPIIPGFAITFHTQAHATIDPGGDMDGDFPLHPGVAGTTTFLTYLFGYLALPLALRTGRHPDKLPEGGAGRLTHLAAAPASGTDIQALCLAAGTTAGGTWLRMHDLNLPVHPGNCILKTDLDPHQEIGTGLGPERR